MSTSPLADRNLLFGVLALQMNFIDQAALVAAMNAWVLDKEKPIGDILLAQEKISAAQMQALDGLIALQIQAHQNDARRSLQSLATISSIGQNLIPVHDPEMQESLACLTTLSHGAPGAALPVMSTNGPRYRTLRFHQGGGLGEVFVAEDIELHREVALKKIRPERADDPAARARFILEAEITGGLEHPGIVPVYGFGAYDDGRPYYAMRFIRGESLRKAIEHFHEMDKPNRDPGERTLAFRQLLRRFVDACNAVAYAHSRGVLHRDLKPMNIMLGDFGETLVIDWGLAKAGVQSAKPAVSATEKTADPSLRPAGSDMLMTHAGAAIGTPQFMSPEQAAGRLEHVHSASDIYSLGATLYILLTGKKPYDGDTDGEVLGRVKAGKFPAPREVKAGTPPALDAVCRKAMAFRPDDRYATALELAADIEHWLADEPVAAYAEPWPARAARWTRRHRTTVVGAVVFLACAVVALAVSTGLIWREEQNTKQQERLAKDNFEVAVDMGDDLMAVIGAVESDLAANPNTHRVRRNSLDHATNKIHSLRAAYPDDPKLKTLAAKLYRYTANVYRLEHDTTLAYPLYQECVGLYKDLRKEDEKEDEHLADTLRDFSSLLVNMGELKMADASIQEAVEKIEARRASSPDTVGLKRSLASAFLNRARLQRAQGKLIEAILTAKEAEQLYADLIRDPGDSPNPYDPIMRAAALNVAAVAERESGATDRALALHRQAVDSLQALKGALRPGLNQNDVVFLLIRCDLERSWTAAALPEKRADAFKSLANMIQTAEVLDRAFPAITQYRQLVADAYELRGHLQVEDGQRESARIDLQKAYDLQADLVKRFPRIPGYRADLGTTQVELGKLARAANDQPKADQWFRQAVQNLQTAAQQAPDHAGIRSSLAKAKEESAKQ